jgi:hypothetical protein
MAAAGAAKAQRLSWAPVGTKWYYEHSGFGSQGNYYFGYILIESIRDTQLVHQIGDQDTLVQATILRETYFNESGINFLSETKVSQDTSIYHATYEFNHEVWIQHVSGYRNVTLDSDGNPIRSPAYKLYDWSLGVGDTFRVAFPFADGVHEARIDRSGTVDVDGRNLRFVEGEFSFNLVNRHSGGTACLYFGENRIEGGLPRKRVFESIGYEGCFKPYACPQVVVEVEGPLRCFEHPDLGSVNFGHRESCIYVLTSRKPRHSAAAALLLTTYVTDGTLRFRPEAAAGRCWVYDVQGREVFSAAYQEVLVLPAGLASGVYVVKIYSTNQSAPAFSRIVVQ